MCMQYRLPLNNLNTFAAAAEHLSFQEAAETLYVTPSAVSHQIRNLEKVLGYPLFDRLDKGVRLTTRGEMLFADIQSPMRQLHEASRKALRGLEDNTLALSVAPIFATGWLLPRLKEFHTSHPDINLSVIVTTDLVDFKTDPFDASIRIGNGHWPEVDILKLFDLEIVAVCHPTILEKHGRLLTPADIMENTLIQNASIPGLWTEWFESASIKNPKRRSVNLQVQNAAQMTEAIQLGDNIGLLDKKFITQDIESGRLAIACEHMLLGNDGYYLVSPESAKDLPALERFKGWLSEQMTKDK